MKCEDCGVWKLALEDVKLRSFRLVPDMAKYLNTNSCSGWVPLVSEEAVRLDKRFRHIVSVMDNECGKECILVVGQFEND